MARWRALGFTARASLPGVTKLTASGVLSEGLTIALLPYIAGRYPPNAIGEFAIAASIAAVVAIVSSLRLEYAIPFAQATDHHQITFASLKLSAIATCVMLAGAGLWDSSLFALAAALSFTSSIQSIGTFAILGHGAPQDLARARISGGVARAGLLLALPLLGSASAFGLASAQAFGSATVGIWCMARVPSKPATTVRVTTSALFARYRTFTTVQLPVALMNAASMEMAIVTLAALRAPTTSIAIAALAQRVVLRPGNILTSAVSDSFLAQVSNEDFHALRRWQTSIQTLLALGAAIAIAGSIASLVTIPLIFEDEYARLHLYAAPLCLIVGARISGNPAQQIVVKLRWHKLNYQLTVSRFLLSCAAPCITYLVTGSGPATLLAYSVISASTYLSISVATLHRLRRMLAAG